MSPREVLEKHTSRELTEWEEEFKRQPFGNTQVVSLLAMLCAVTANGLGVKRKGGGDWSSQDFCKTLQDAPQIESDESIAAKLAATAKLNKANPPKPKPVVAKK